MSQDGGVKVSPTQRFLRRIALLDKLDDFMRESAYHRNHDEEEALPVATLWVADSDIGELVISDDNTC